MFKQHLLPFGTEVDIGPGDNVLDGVAAPPKRGTAPPPVFDPCVLLPNGWAMKTPLGTEADLGPGHIVLDGVLALRKRGPAAPSFQSMSIVATVAHLSYC